MDFNLQRYLETMEDRAEARHLHLAEKLDELATDIGDHTIRLVVLEGREKRRQWYLATAATAFVTFLFDLVVNHWGK